MPEGSLQVLIFEVGGQRHGLPAADVQELLRAVRIVPLPGAPAIVEGLMNLRGRVVPVLDVRRRLRLPARPLDPSDHFIIARTGSRLVALHVDRALDLLELDPADLEDTGDIAPGPGRVARVARLPHDLLLLHDPGALLSPEESAALDGVVDRGGAP